MFLTFSFEEIPVVPVVDSASNATTTNPNLLLLLGKSLVTRNFLQRLIQGIGRPLLPRAFRRQKLPICKKPFLFLIQKDAVGSRWMTFDPSSSRFNSIVPTIIPNISNRCWMPFPSESQVINWTGMTFCMS